MWGFAGGAFDFFVSLVTNQQDVVTLFVKALNLAVNFGHKRTGGVDGLLVTSFGRFDNCRRYSMSGENHNAALRSFINLIHENRAAAL